MTAKVASTTECFGLFLLSWRKRAREWVFHVIPAKETGPDKVQYLTRNTHSSACFKVISITINSEVVNTSTLSSIRYEHDWHYYDLCCTDISMHGQSDSCT